MVNTRNWKLLTVLILKEREADVDTKLVNNIEFGCYYVLVMFIIWWMKKETE